MKDLEREKRLETMRRDFAKGLKRRLKEENNALVADILLRSAARRQESKRAAV